MAVYLVTGGAGFIGSHIVFELLRRRQRVRILDNFSTGKRENLSPVLSRVQLVEGDIRDAQTVARAVQGVHYVLHQAALASVPRSIDNPLETTSVNVQGTLNLLTASRDAGVNRFIFASSSSVYGPTRRLPKAEGMSPNPISPYAVSKLAGELYNQIFFSLYSLETVCLRYFNVFGPRQDPSSQYAAVIPRFILAMLRGEPALVYGDGEQSRDFAYVANVVEANILACRAATAAGQVINVACGSRHTINDLFRALQVLIDPQAVVRYESARPGDVRHSQADISRGRRVLGYRPRIGFEDGLKKTVTWFRRASGSKS